MWSEAKQDERPTVQGLWEPASPCLVPFLRGCVILVGALGPVLVPPLDHVLSEAGSSCRCLNQCQTRGPVS